MNLPTDSTPEKDTLKALFEAREAKFQEEIYKSYAMAATSETYYAVQKIAIALIKDGICFNENFPNKIAKDAIAIHEQIRDYSDKQKQELTNETELPQQND